MNRKVAVIGLGYVGLPLYLAFARKFPNVIGYDIDAAKIKELQSGIDRTGELDPEDLKGQFIYTSKVEDLKKADFFIVAVPTPIDNVHKPDLSYVVSASELVGKVLKPGDIVAYESTVYPGVTEEVCGPVLEKVSALKCGVDFKLAYSPERINPGDKEHTVEKIVKVVSGQDRGTLEIVAQVYGSVITAGVYRAQSIRVAEAAKVIENTQRDLNIALMNELALIFDRMNISTKEVLKAAGTKWNFLKFSPGLVGGHCIGVDPYYLTTKAEQIGYHPQVILSGRRINDGMGQFVAQKMVKLLVNLGVTIKNARVGILGLTFKENVRDIRNSRVPDIINELRQFGIQTVINDPFASKEEVHEEYGLELTDFENINCLDGVILAVSHKPYLDMPSSQLLAGLKDGGVLVDVRSALDPQEIGKKVLYWSL